MLSFTSKCCMESFCDKCIRDHVIEKSMCVCGATGLLADYLIPNQTLRELIIHMLQYGNSSRKYGVTSSRTRSSAEYQKAAPKKEKLSSSSEASTIASEIHRDPRYDYSEHNATLTGTRKRAAAASSSTEDQKAASKKEKLSSSSEASTIASETGGDPTYDYSEYKATSTGTRKRAATANSTSDSER